MIELIASRIAINLVLERLKDNKGHFQLYQALLIPMRLYLIEYLIKAS